MTISKLREAFFAMAREEGKEYTREEIAEIRDGLMVEVENNRANGTGWFAGRDPVVYYARVGNRIKIGYTTNLKQRMASLLPEELLATEPGGFQVEQFRHAQFWDHHSSGEWFEDCPQLRAHIEKVKKRGGRVVA